MKKQIIMLLALVSGLELSAQWEMKTVDNGFDEPFRVAYAESTTGKEFIKLYNSSISGYVGLLMYEGYMCSEKPGIEMSFLVNGKWEKYELLYGVTSEDKKLFYILTSVKSIEADFRAASMLKIRVTDDHCGTEIYEFNMKGSAAALDFMLGGQP